MMETRPDVEVSVVIPSKNRPGLLRRCLEALQAQSLPADSFEVLVCDDGTSGATRELIPLLMRKYPSGPLLRYLPPGTARGPAAARNRGWQHARAPVIAFTDDDTVPAADWLACGLRALDQGADAVSGQIVVPVPQPPNDYQRDAAALSGSEFATANCFVRRAALERVGGFDERFTIAWREDSDLHFSLLEAGMKLVRAPDAIVHHPVREAGFAAGLAMQRKVVFDSLLLRKHPGLYRSRIRCRPPWLYLLISLSALVAPGAWIAGLPDIARFAAGAWLLLSAWFFCMRLAGSSHRPRDLADLLITSVLIPPLSIGWRLIGMLRYGGRMP